MATAQEKNTCSLQGNRLAKLLRATASYAVCTTAELYCSITKAFGLLKRKAEKHSQILISTCV